MEEKLAVLQLPPRKRVARAPASGVLPVVSHGQALAQPFPHTAAWAGETIFHASAPVLAMLQNLHTCFVKARAQLVFALPPREPDFILFCPDSVYTPEDAGAMPWNLKQLESVQVCLCSAA